MAWVLERIAPPSWKKCFSEMRDARKELLKHICKDCLEGEVVRQGGGKVIAETLPPNQASLSELLDTVCGRQFECYLEGNPSIRFPQQEDLDASGL